MKMSGYTSLEEIDQLTREFRESIIQPDGSRVLKAEHTEYMRTIHFDVPNMGYHVLFELPRFLVRTTIFPRGARYGNADEPHFLTWMTEICHFTKWNFKYQDRRFTGLFDLLVSSHLANASGLPSSLNFHLTRFLGSFHVFAACFAFPFLERCVRTKCKEYVRADGLVLREFRIPRYGKRDRSYDTGDYISNISHELKLLELYVATSEFRQRLRRFMDELNEDSWLRFNDPFELVSYWRNRLLHGEQIWSIGWDAATYLICMTLMSEIPKEEYNSKKDDLKEHIKSKQQTASPFLWYRYKLE